MGSNEKKCTGDLRVFVIALLTMIIVLALYHVGCGLVDFFGCGSVSSGKPAVSSRYVMVPVENFRHHRRPRGCNYLHRRDGYRCDFRDGYRCDFRDGYRCDFREDSRCDFRGERNGRPGFRGDTPDFVRRHHPDRAHLKRRGVRQTEIGRPQPPVPGAKARPPKAPAPKAPAPDAPAPDAPAPVA